MGFQKILVAIDDSQLSNCIFNSALDLARTNQGALMLFHSLTNNEIGEPVVPIPTQLGLDPVFIDHAYEAQHLRLEKSIKQVQELLKNYCDIATQAGIATEFDYKVGDAGELICQAAENWDADLIVMGRRGRTGVTEAFLGSVSNHVLHHACCSVLVMQGGKINAHHSPGEVSSENKAL